MRSNLQPSLLPRLLFLVFGLATSLLLIWNWVMPAISTAHPAQTGSTTSRETAPPNPTESTTGSPEDSPVEVQERWYLVELLGQRAGYLHTEVQPVEHAGRPAVRTREELRQEVARLNGGLTESVLVRSDTVWVENLQGNPLSLQSTLDQGGGEVVTTLEVQGSTARLRQRGAAGRRDLQVPWNSAIRGSYGAQREIAPLLSGERRSVRFTTFSIEAGNRLLEIEARRLETREDGSTVIAQTLGDLKIESREVYDAAGELMEQQLGPVTLRRTTRKEALAPLEQSLSAFERISVSLDHILDDSRDLRRAAYRLAPRDDGSPSLTELFPSDQRQRVEERPEGPTLVVRVPPEPRPNPTAPATPPGQRRTYLDATGLLESDDPTLRALAKRLTDGVDDPLRRAHNLQSWVSKNIRFRGSGVGLATARQTFDSRDGDCTENAFLLAALLRAADLPSRIVVGLVYTGSARPEGARQPTGRLVPHAWVETWIHGTWVAYDSALPAPRVDATHLAMAKSAGGEEGSLLDTTAPLLRGLGRFDLVWAGER
ncbi:MAG: transglutaminase-like domain-containing protein [Acidobacteriota bacterium]|nr:transglutaminase-like domain-containing protein [Acidobacteriota bacterium]